DVEHVGLGAESKAFSEQPDLLVARRILDLVVALGDGVEPRHRRSLCLPRALAGGADRGASRALRCHTRAREAVQHEQEPRGAAGCLSFVSAPDPGHGRPWFTIGTASPPLEIRAEVV